MPGISPDIICHRLSIDPKTKPVRQKRRSYDAERYKAMKAEVEKLKGIGFIRKVNYPTWVANVVLVKKNPTKENRLIDYTTWCELLSFMDAYSGYNQILMNPSDQEHTAFTTDRGLYCYKIGKSMEVYVDDMLVKSKHADQHITNLSENFTIMKRFIFKVADRCASLSKALKGSKKYITWTDECAEAFKNLKDYMSKAHLLSKPEVGDTLIIYLSVSASAVSSVLIRKDGNVERPVYYASKTLQDAETRYSNIEKLALALVMSARKLRPYFQAHSFIMLTNHPLRQILQSPDTSGRMIKWAITLGEFGISYQPKPAEKGQAMADFIADFTYPVDIVSTPKEGCGAGLVITTPDKVAMEYALRFKFKASNNEAEYEALLAGLRLSKHLGVTNNFDAKDSSMVAYLA
ncbi:hypothetical protein PS2_000147 [Malus domestica]